MFKNGLRSFFFFFMVASNLQINLFIKLCSLLEGIYFLIVLDKNGPIKIYYRRVYHEGEDPLIPTCVNATVEELENPCGSFMGYRQFTRRLRKKYHLTVRRDTIMQCLRVIDPEGVDRRKRRRLKRRRYATPGPNFLWHALMAGINLILSMEQWMAFVGVFMAGSQLN